MSIRNLFNERRTAQAAAFMLSRAGGQLPLIKLLKLLYLAERKSLKEYGEPITGDKLGSMDNGPVLLTTLNHINGQIKSCEGGWDSWISDRAGHNVALRDPSMIRSPEQDLTALSDSDLEVLGSIWGEFGHLGKWVLVEYTHEALGEWQNPHGSIIPISYERLFEVLGYGHDQAEAVISRLSEQASINEVFPA
jgi:uncharacterized phage-associated protein